MCRLLNADASGAGPSIDNGRVLLPANVKPLAYHLTLEPNFTDFKYEGKVIIDLDVVEETSSLSVNTVEIDIKSTRIECGDITVSNVKTSYDEDKQQTKIDFEEKLPAGSKAKMTIDFIGTLNDNMAGFYRSTYKLKDGSEKMLATSQMEPTDARRAFPCFDEPALKAKFTITLIAEDHMTCLSNMDQVHEEQVDSKSGGKKKSVTFRETPPMSTYLLAFVVGELKVIETNDFRVPVRVYTTLDQDVEHGRFALDIAVRTLKFYEQQFKSEYPLPKMDMIAIPDFSAGAMENWGLVTYRTAVLLYNEKTDSANAKEVIAEVVQHELAHQWFGNLVTMDFWEGLWLNEGFATWMSWYSTNEFFPEWKVWENYVTDNLSQALALDSLRSSHPIEVPVKRAQEVNQIFDAISYSKGSAVLRMISKYLGEDTFLRGIQLYLAKHAYENTQTPDLWAALSRASGKDVEKTMAIWTKKVGYPVLAVTEDESKKTIHVKQNRFLKTADVKPEEDETLYPVFLALRSKDGVDESMTLTEREGNFEVKDLDFFKLNADHAGIYRTSYSTERLEKLGKAAKDGLLTVEDRAGMIADAGALASAGYQKTSGLLSLLKGFDSETQFVVWSEITANIAALRGAWRFEPEHVTDALKKYELELCSAKAHELGWDFSNKDDHVLQRFKALLFGAAGSAGDEKVKAAAFEMLEKYAAGDKSAIDPNIRSKVYNICLSNGGEKEYDFVLKQYQDHTLTENERNDALVTLGAARKPELIQRTLANILKDVRNQDVPSAMVYLSTHKEGIEAMWTWFQENFAELERRLPAGLGMLGSCVSCATRGFGLEEQVKNMESFFGKRDIAGYDQLYAQVLDRIRAKLQWVNRDRKDVEEWLKSQNLLQ